MCCICVLLSTHVMPSLPASASRRVSAVRPVRTEHVLAPVTDRDDAVTAHVHREVNRSVGKRQATPVTIAGLSICDLPCLSRVYSVVGELVCQYHGVEECTSVKHYPIVCLVTALCCGCFLASAVLAVRGDVRLSSISYRICLLHVHHRCYVMSVTDVNDVHDLNV
jgi:hypothetical protein